MFVFSHGITLFEGSGRVGASDMKRFRFSSEDKNISSSNSDKIAVSGYTIISRF